MITFLKLWENMQSQEDSPLQSSGESSLAMQAIRSGLGLSSGNSRSFWDDFLSVCRDSDSMADLLEVRPEQVAKWQFRIKEMIDRVNREDDNQSKTVIPTGDKFSFEN